MLEINYVKYVLDGVYTLEELTSKNVDKYNKIVKLLSSYKAEFNNLCTVAQDNTIKYIISKLDKRYKFHFDYMFNDEFIFILKLYRDIEFTGATALEIDSILKEFNNNNNIIDMIEDLKRDKYIQIEGRADLNQIRFLN